MLKVAGEHGNWREVLALHLQSVDEMPAEERGRNWSLKFLLFYFGFMYALFVQYYYVCCQTH